MLSKENSSFRGISKDIQNDLISSISSVLKTEIKNQIKDSSFISIILDETSDIKHKSQLSVVFRYVIEGVVYERFVEFKDVSADRTANGLFEVIKILLEDYGISANGISDKLVAQCYDGASVMSGHLTGLQSRVKEIAKNADFVHCMAHRLNLVLEQSLSSKKATSKCRVFFLTVKGISTFFSSSSKRIDALVNYINRQIPTVSDTRWNYMSHVLHVIYDNYDNLVIFFEEVKSDEDDTWDADTQCKAIGFLNFLNDVGNRFLISALKYILGKSDIVYNTLQKKSFDVVHCQECVNNFISDIKNNKDLKFEESWKFATDSENAVLNRKESKSIYKDLYDEIVGTISDEVESRFESLSSYTFMNLLNHHKYKEYKLSFPENLLNSLRMKYNNIFNYVSLKIELTSLYENDYVKTFSISDLTDYLVSFNLDAVYPQTYLLAILILTVPSSSASAERSFSALKRIHTAKRSAQTQGRMVNLNLLSIEKELLMKLKRCPFFYDKVINEFVKKSRNIELIYR